MIRPMASNVSALSSVVAKGHQAIHFVSSTPLGPSIPCRGRTCTCKHIKDRRLHIEICSMAHPTFTCGVRRCSAATTLIRPLPGCSPSRYVGNLPVRQSRL